MRPDWEEVITPFVDYAVTRGQIAADKIVLFGYSLAGYLVARAAAFAGNLPPYIASWIDEGRDDVAVPVLTMIAAVSIRLRWGLCNGRWLFGATPSPT